MTTQKRDSPVKVAIAMRIKYARLLQNQGVVSKDGKDVDIIGSVLQNANLNATLYEKIAKRRAKA